MPVSAEPRHHLKLATADIRVFDVTVPPNDTTLFHVHGSDYAYVTFGNASLVAEALGGTPAPLVIADGEVRFTRGPLTHRVSNPSPTPFHNLTIELLRTAPASDFDPLVVGDSIVMDNERVRVVRHLVPAGATLVLEHSRGRALDVFVSAATIEEDEYDGAQAVPAGSFRWREASGQHQVYNLGDHALVLVTLYLK